MINNKLIKIYLKNKKHLFNVSKTFADIINKDKTLNMKFY